jgi:hypothetical protein
LKHDPDHPEVISFIVGAEARKEFVLCYSDDHKNSSTAARFNAKPNSGFGFAAASAVLAALKQVLTRSLPKTVLVQHSQGATQGLDRETGK